MNKNGQSQDGESSLRHTEVQVRATGLVSPELIHHNKAYAVELYLSAAISMHTSSTQLEIPIILVATSNTSGVNTVIDGKAGSLIYPLSLPNSTKHAIPTAHTRSCRAHVSASPCVCTHAKYM